MFLHFINLFFPETPLERYISDVVAGRKELPIPQCQIIGEGLSIFSYRNPIIRELMWHLKYKGDRRIATLFGQTMAPIVLAYMKQTTLPKPYLVTGIPLSRRRLWWRGFNQADLVAKAVCAHDPETFVYSPNVLKRTKHKTPQAKIRNTAERLFNAHGIFAVNKNKKIVNETILLVDDVLTTGATLRSAGATLKKAGALHVVWVAVAH